MQDLILPTRFDADELAAISARLAGIGQRRLRGHMPRAAVLVPLCHCDGEPAVLFTKRSEQVGTHKGHVSFPGGRVDPGDVDAIDTALRELQEEVGIERRQVMILGGYHEATAMTGVGVTPIVGFVGDIAPASLLTSAAEIDEAFCLRLADLVMPEHRSIQRFGSRSAPVFSAGPFPVWGLTAWIMDEILREGLGLALEPLGTTPLG